MLHPTACEFDVPVSVMKGHLTDDALEETDFHPKHWDHIEVGMATQFAV